MPDPTDALRGLVPRAAHPRLGACLPIVVGVVAAVVASVAQAQGSRPATLTIERNETCLHAAFPDTMRSVDTVPLMLPAGDGSVSGTGRYDHTGTGYSLSGSSVYRGRIEGGDTLVLTFGQWHWQGKALTPVAPEMPTAGHPVVLRLAQGAEAHVAFKNAHADKAPCSGTVLYRLDLAP
ncbi:hypothetical protein [Roseospira visakhapatnamensis]|uniref:Uncharacterized protein n=1 Tax=Roseospira visakhapatnamensis TaxID=390880 RepID=A0A7W6REF8_9PROT|nr:hypothetical protein [Roseospira visakhapatnamensis]MBB4266551.1 hypothetical protein [Roseospira visakhapatnamensis]